MNKKILLGVVFVIVILLIAYLASVKKSPAVSSMEQTSVPVSQNQTIPINTYDWCMANGGKDSTYEFNAPRNCILDNKVYTQACISNDKYFVTSQDLTESVGSDILVKYKINKDQNFACNYIIEKNDFVIKNEWAEYVFAITNNFLLLDSGTGPSGRNLIIYNLETRQKIYTDGYSEPVTIKENIITYWAGSDKKANIGNCSKINEYLSYGGDAIIETLVTLDLTNLKKTELGEDRCEYNS